MILKEWNKIIESQTTELNTKTSETASKTNDANTEKPKSASESVVSNPKINRDRVIIEDWNSDDEEKVYEVQTVRPETQTGNPDILLQDHAVVDSGCSSHMTGNKAYLSDYEDYNGGFVAFGSDPKGEFDQEKDKGPTQEYILLPLQPHRTRIPVEDVPLAAHEKPSESSPKDNDVQDSEDAADKEEQHQMKESEQDLQDELEKMVTQELAAKAMDDVSRQAFKEENRRIASQKKAAQATSTNKLSTDSNLYAASTPTGENAGESSFVYLGGKIPIDASTVLNADLPIDLNMPDLEDGIQILSPSMIE
ncbi:hypothetical protein Tco_1554024 [Tanacetum coccineum]